MLQDAGVAAFTKARYMGLHWLRSLWGIALEDVWFQVEKSVEPLHAAG